MGLLKNGETGIKTFRKNYYNIFDFYIEYIK